MPHSRKTLHLHEEVLLLALRNDKGTVAGGVMFDQAVGGAMLAELILERRIRTVTEGRSTYAEVESEQPLGDPVLDEALHRVATAGRRAKLQKWVERFAGTRRLKHRVASGLVRRHILREEESQVLLWFTRRTYPERDAEPERQLVERISRAIFSDTGEVDARTTVLVALGQHSGLLRANLDRKRLRSSKRRIQTIVKGDVVGAATKQAIDAVRAAVMVAVLIPAVVASSH